MNNMDAITNHKPNFVSYGHKNEQYRCNKFYNNRNKDNDHKHRSRSREYKK